MSTAVPVTTVSSDEYRAWIVLVATFLSNTLGMRFICEALPPDQVGRLHHSTREVTVRIGAELEDQAWFLEHVLDRLGVAAMFTHPLRRVPVLQLVPNPREPDPRKWRQTVQVPTASGPTRHRT